MTAEDSHGHSDRLALRQVRWLSRPDEWIEYSKLLALSPPRATANRRRDFKPREGSFDIRRRSACSRVMRACSSATDEKGIRTMKKRRDVVRERIR